MKELQSLGLDLKVLDKEQNEINLQAEDDESEDQIVDSLEEMRKEQEEERRKEKEKEEPSTES